MRTARKLILASRTAGPSEVTFNEVSRYEVAKGKALTRAQAVKNLMIMSSKFFNKNGFSLDLSFVLYLVLSLMMIRITFLNWFLLLLLLHDFFSLHFTSVKGRLIILTNTQKISLFKNFALSLYMEWKNDFSPFYFNDPFSSGLNGKGWFKQDDDDLHQQ